MIIKYNPLWKPIQGHFSLKRDGIPGPRTLSAIAGALGVWDLWTAVQAAVGVAEDGTPGPNTAQAVLDKLNIPSDPALKWPTQAEVRSGKSIFGKPGQQSNLTSFTPPYQMYFEGKPVKTITCHKLIAPALARILSRTLEHYGTEQIHKLGLDQYDGCYNNRKVTNGKSTSLHAWGIALDIYAAKNGYNLTWDKAAFSKPDYTAFNQFWLDEGATNLGMTANFDPMHWQFARR